MPRLMNSSRQAHRRHHGGLCRDQMLLHPGTTLGHAEKAKNTETISDAGKALTVLRHFG